MLRVTRKQRSPARRAEERKQVYWPTEWRSFTDHPGADRCSERGYIRDVSKRGLFIEVCTRLPALPLGTQVRLWLSPRQPSDDHDTVIATVRWRGLSSIHGCPGIGVELL